MQELYEKKSREYRVKSEDKLLHLRQTCCRREGLYRSRIYVEINEYGKEDISGGGMFLGN